jgi:hypothetical protein
MELNLTENAEYNLTCSWWQWYVSIVTTIARTDRLVNTLVGGRIVLKYSRRNSVGGCELDLFVWGQVPVAAYYTVEIIA